MEEIIASISRIIAEDGRPGDTPRPAPAEQKDVFELTEAIGEDGSVRRIKPAGAADGPTAKPPGAAKAPSPPLGPRIEPEPPRAEPAIGTPGPRPMRERILSAATSEAAAASFARLGAMPRERPREGELLMGAGDRTLEEIVRETLRPLLQAWLDEHLPAIVERLVREEIARVVGEAGIR
ncbi:MAG TPA: DUF2497 domain-containing protein [Stellaceae bacterium]